MAIINSTKPTVTESLPKRYFLTWLQRVTSFDATQQSRVENSLLETFEPCLFLQLKIYFVNTRSLTVGGRSLE